MKNLTVGMALLGLIFILGCHSKEKATPSLENGTEAGNPQLILSSPQSRDFISAQKEGVLSAQDPRRIFFAEDQVSSLAPTHRGGVQFSSALKLNDKILTLRGTTIRKFEISALSLITIYTAGFYAPIGVDFSDDIPDVEKIMILQYHLDVDKSKVIEAIKQNVYSNPQVESEKVRPYFEKLSDAFDSPKKGDRYLFNYIPGKGTAMIKAGKILTVIPTREFEKAFFWIWLSAHGKDLEMRCELLALPCPEKRSLNPVNLISNNLSGAKEKLGKLKNLVS